MGGTIALEMARLLKAKNEEVALVALFDTYNFVRALPANRLYDLAQRFRFHLGNFIRLSPALMKDYLREKIRVARDGEFSRLFGSSQEPKPSHKTIGRSTVLTIQATNDRAAMLYQPRPYPGSVTLFNPRVNYAKFPDVHMGWDGLILGGIEIVTLPMNPHAMLVEPTVKHLAAALAARLDR